VYRLKAISRSEIFTAVDSSDLTWLTAPEDSVGRQLLSNSASLLSTLHLFHHSLVTSPDSSASVLQLLLPLSLSSQRL
jgi:hypothetical protein